MLRINRHFVWSVFLILVVLVNLMNVNVVLADDSTPPPPATDEPTQPPVEPTETPVVEETPVPTESPAPTETPVSQEETSLSDEEADVSEILQGLPENTEIVVLDENGNPIPLASQDAAQIILDTDPMWCPVVAGVPTLPGGVGCTINFATGQALIDNMDSSNPATLNSAYEQNGIIYFTTNPGGSFALVPGTGNAIETSDYNVLKTFSLILQGGWNGSNGGAATFTGQTNFGTNTLTIGTSGNPWVGDVTLNNFAFSGASANAVTVYTTTGDIALNNVDVSNQRGNAYAAVLDSNSGDITVQNGSSFDGNTSGGNSNQSRGFSADTATGAITISDTSFTDSRGCLNIIILCVDLLANNNGATLSAPTVTLTNVTANNNDGTGIRINNANLVTLNNVTATNNGTITLPIRGGGVDIDGTGATIVNVTGGTFSNNTYYGIYMDGVFVGLTFVPDGTLNYLTQPTCSGNALPLLDPDNCDNLQDTTPPVLTLPANITAEATSASGAAVNYTATATDNVDGAVAVTCAPPSGSTFALTTTTVNCSASDSSGNTANGSFTVTVQDTTPPTISPMANILVHTTNELGEIVSYSSPATNDLVDGAGIATCSPASGTLFPAGNTTVTCSATDSHGNTASITFNVHVNPTTTSSTAPSGSAGIIPITGGETVDLECFTVANAFGVLVTFYNLCDQQAVMDEIGESTLPSALPSGYTFVKGLNVDILGNGQLLNALPGNAGIQMDFPLPSGSEFVVLYWNNGEWVEISQLGNNADLDALLAADADNELYKLSSSNANVSKALTTELFGTFVLVQK